ncbi:SBBP repeat-containing protein [Myxococcota bacterium]|nr:SBBP repeat-containing protein [Myxococcota bacterium]
MMDIPDGPGGLCNPNGVLEVGETCDGSELGTAACSDYGYSGGALVCRANCTLDTSGCGGTCGDGRLDPAFETCEGDYLQDSTCESIGHYPGVLGCTTFCQYDTSGCGGTCGDGVVQNDFEQCDGADLAGLTCRDDGKFFGTPACGAACGLDSTFCRDTELWGTPGLEIGTALTITPDGSIFVTGPTNGTMDGQSPSGGTDIYLTRYDAGGNRQWSRQWGSNANDIGSGVRVDAGGNIYVSGAVSGVIDDQVSQGGEDIILSKFDAFGNRLWSRQWGSIGDDQSTGVALDAAGDVYVTGYVAGPLLGQTHAGSDDAFLIKVSSDGDVLWARQWGTAGDDTAYAVTIDAADNVYVTGRTNGALDGEVNQGDFDAFLTRFNTDGNTVWTRLWGSIDDERGHGVTTDASGFIYITGLTSGSLDGLPLSGGDDVTLTKFGPGGLRLWSRQWGSPAEDRGYGVAADALGNVCVTGHTKGDLDDQPFHGVEDIFLSCYTVDGTKQWSRQWGTPLIDRGVALAMNAGGDMFITGYTESTLNEQASTGLYDIYLLYVAGF